MHTIVLHKFVWAASVIGIFVTLGHAVYTENMMMWILAYLYFRLIRLITFHIGIHRYFSHNAFKTGKIRHVLLAWSTILIGQGSPITWSIHHRHHHKYSDTDLDVHSPYDKENKWLSVAGIFSLQPLSWWNRKKVFASPRNLLRDPTCRFVHDHYYLLMFTISLTVVLLAGWQFWLYFILNVIGLFYLHTTLFTYITHKENIPGNYRNFDTPDKSYNNKFIAWYSPEEAYHNNHHADPTNYRIGIKPHEFDPVAWVVEKFFILK
jgi:stearoyl-CoA desaturase (delta-9 desaturase)